jgi:glutathione S-transferase
VGVRNGCEGASGVPGFRSPTVAAIAGKGRWPLIGGDRINESDALGRFLAERSLLASSYRIRSSELYVAWATWCDQEGEQAGSNKAFTAAMLNKGYDNDRDRRGNWFLGCRAPCRNQP